MFSAATGRLETMKSFAFLSPRRNRRVVRDANVEITKEFDGFGRMTDVWFKFNDYVVFTLEMKFDELSRLYQWRRKVGTSDLKAYEYLYDSDSNLLQVCAYRRIKQRPPVAAYIYSKISIPFI